MTTSEPREEVPAEPRQRVDEFLLDELTDQLERTRRLLTGSPERAAEAALDRLGGQAEVEARIAAELAIAFPLADPERFPGAHRLAIRALEVLDREGSRAPGAPRLGPLSPLVEAGIAFIADYIVKSYAADIAERLRRLYARREAQCPPGTADRHLLARARMEMERLAPGFAGGGVAAPILVGAGAVLPLLASVSNYLGAVDLGSRAVLWSGIGLLFLLFFLLSMVMLRGAAVARRRSRLIMQQPLAALWQTIGHAGDPPEDDSVLFATVALVLTATAWFVLPAVAGLVFLVD